MILPSSHPAVSARRPNRKLLLAGGLILLSLALAYANSFSGVFVFDDLPSIVENPSLRRTIEALIPRSGPGHTVEGRPLLNFTFALNYALSGLHPWSYHAGNLLIHALAALTLMGIIRRTLQLSWCPEGWRNDSLTLAATVALLWAVHPLQTAAVTYVVQRAESLCGLWYLLTLYGFIRHCTASGGERTRWLVVTVGSCLAGMATKEVMVTAPLLVLAYDRLFLATSWNEVWRKNGRLHLLLAGTWLLLLWLAAGTGLRGGTAGFNEYNGIWLYFLTQFGAIDRYVRLSCWPEPLVFDYGRGLVTGLGDVWPQALAFCTVGLATLAAFLRNRPVAFCGLWFLLILAPSSSFVPINTQTMAEHRLYLPLAALVAGAVLAGHRWLGLARLATLVLLATIAGITLTIKRNATYHSSLAVWEDTVRKLPGNARAQLNLGAELFLAGRHTEALVHFREAVRLEPEYSDAHTNLGNALKATGHRPGALTHYAEAVRLDPGNLVARCNYAAALAKEDRLREAEQHYAAALRAGAAADVRNEWAIVLGRLERTGEAEAALRAALRENPSLASAQLGLGNLLARTGRHEEAVSALHRAVQLQPDSADARNSLGYLLLLQGRPAEAVPHFEAALRGVPGTTAIRANYAVALTRLGRTADARIEIAHILRLDPTNALAHALLAELTGADQR